MECTASLNPEEVSTACLPARSLPSVRSDNNINDESPCGRFRLIHSFNPFIHPFHSRSFYFYYSPWSVERVALDVQTDCQPNSIKFGASHSICSRGVK